MQWNRKRLERDLGNRYAHHSIDIRDDGSVDSLVKRCGGSVNMVVHTAAQPSHDRAAPAPRTDFDANIERWNEAIVV